MRDPKLDGDKIDMSGDLFLKRACTMTINAIESYVCKNQIYGHLDNQLEQIAVALPELILTV